MLSVTSVPFTEQVVNWNPVHEEVYCHYSMQHYLIKQGSSHLQKTGRLDFSLREHEGGVKAWQGDFQQLHRDMFPQKCVVYSHHLKKIHLKCDFNANILLISFIFNFIFMFYTCIIVVDLIFVDFRFYPFRIEICSVLHVYTCILHQNVSSFPCFH